MTKAIKIKGLLIGEGIPKICVPLTGTTKEFICQEAKAAKEVGADLVEWRADFFEGLLDQAVCQEVLDEVSEILDEIPLLFTIRTKEEGGSIEISLEEYAGLQSGCGKKPQSRPGGCGSDGKSAGKERT